MGSNLRWRKPAAFAGGMIGIVLLLIFAATTIFYSGFPPAKDEPPMVVHAACPLRRPSANDAAAIAKRNIVWSVLNGETVLPPAPATQIGFIIVQIIGPHSTPQERQNGWDRYRNITGTLATLHELDEISTAELASATATESVTALRIVVSYDREAAELVSQVLADKERIRLFLAGQPIPLEEAPAP